MEFVGTLEKSGSWYASGIESLEVWSQGKTKKNAVNMVILALDELAESYLGKKLNFEIVWIKDNKFAIRANKFADVAAFILRHCRLGSKKTLHNVAQKVGTKGVNSIRQYETGAHAPSLEKFDALLGAMGKTLRIEIVDCRH